MKRKPVGQPRKRIEDKVVPIRATVPPVVYRWLIDLGRGSVSAGLRVAWRTVQDVNKSLDKNVVP